MYKAPAARMDKLTGIRLRLLTFTSGHTSELDRAGWQKINSWNGLIADGNLTLGSADVYSTESGEVLEESIIGSSHGQLHLWQLGKDTEVSHSVLLHNHVLPRFDGAS